MSENPFEAGSSFVQWPKPGNHQVLRQMILTTPACVVNRPERVEVTDFDTCSTGRQSHDTVRWFDYIGRDGSRWRMDFDDIATLVDKVRKEWPPLSTD
jgi:hypothetical protein